MFVKCCLFVSILGMAWIIHRGDIIHVIMRSVAGIYILQQIDTKIDRCRKRINEITSTLDDNRAVADAAKNVDRATESMQTAAKEHGGIQGEIDIVTSKHENGEKRLYSGTVTNPKELKDLQDQGEALSRRIAELEDAKLEAMIMEEDCKEGLEDALGHHDVALHERKMLEQKLNAESKTNYDNVKKLQGEREVALNSIAEELVNSYEVARSKYRGIAVVLIDDGMCSGCGLGVSTGHIQAARSGDSMVTCDNCHRFLYVK